MREIRIQINGTNHISRIPDNMTLLEYIREELGMSGTKEDAIAAIAAVALFYWMGGRLCMHYTGHTGRWKKK